MFIETHFFIATVAQVLAADFTRSPVGQLPGARAKHVGVERLCQLECILDGTDPVKRLADIDLMLVWYEPTETRWVMKLPQDMVWALAAADAQALARYGLAWGTRPALLREVHVEAGSPEVLRLLAALARAAVTSERDLYVWLSQEEEGAVHGMEATR